MFATFKRNWYKRVLKNRDYAFLLDAPITEEFVACDCETTGLDPKKAEIVSIGAVKIIGNKIVTSERFDLFVKPSKNMSEESIKIHHIRNCDVENGVDIEVAIESFARFIGTRTLVGYYLEFDVAMIDKYLSKFAGIKLQK